MDNVVDLDGTELNTGDKIIAHTMWGGEPRGGIGLIRLYVSHMTANGRLSLVRHEESIKGHPDYKYGYPFYRYPDQVLKIQNEKTNNSDRF